MPLQPATVMYVGGFELPDKNAAALRVRSIAGILRRLGHETVLVGVNKEIAAYVHRDRRDGDFDVWETPYPRSAVAWMRHLVSARAIKEILRRYEGCLRVIICYNYPALPLLILRRYARRSGMRIIGDVTEWYSSGYGSPVFRLAKFLDTFLRMRLAHFHTDGVITVSSYLYRYYAGGLRHVVRVPVLFDAGGITPGDVYTYSATGARKTLFYAGSPFPSRRRGGSKFIKDRIDVALLILASLHGQGVPFLFHIWGVSAEEYLEVFPQHRAMLSDLGQCVIFHGRGTHQQVLESLSLCDFCIFLRTVDRVTVAGFPTKLAESISYGVPVITNLTSDIGEYVVDGVTGFLIQEGSIEEQAAKVRSILSLSADYCREMKVSCSASKAFSTERFIAPVRGFLQGVLDENG